MSKKYKALILLVILSIIGLFAALFAYRHNIAMLNPQGIVATKERNLMLLTVFMSLFVIIPVYIMTFVIAWKYRETNAKAKYNPDWDSSTFAETVWWAIPIIIISILAVITWNTSHSLDPFKPLDSNKPPLTVQVVALDWKWLFIYPKQQIASVNYIQIPENTPVKFEITSDAPMNSFWIPELGGQIYAMSGMSTNLNLMADRTGSYRGSSANISGRGFAGMHFTVESVSRRNFDNWTYKVRQDQNILDLATYNKLARPSQNNRPIHYSNVDPHLYDTIVMKYMNPGNMADGAAQ
jgi:cytochrome o ubiquinol oxidase subunit 2